MNELRKKIVAEAQRWVGTPYHHAARIHGAGVDCAMLLCEVYERCGLIPHVEPGPYPPDWHMHRSEEQFLGWIKQFAVPVENPDHVTPGDVLLFKYGRCVSHAGICIDRNGGMIHAHMRAGKVCGDNALMGDFAKRLDSAWTFEAFRE